MINPFPGPQPYRASDRDRFFGRDEAARRLSCGILANRCLTLYGPSGAGKSSLMQAKVIPELDEEHDYRCVWIEGWPGDQDPIATLLDSIYAQLRLGEKPPGTEANGDAVVAALELAERRSDRPILIYLDQVEQLIFAARNRKDLPALGNCIARIVDSPAGEARVVLALREDYLGRFRDRLRARRRLLEHGFRLGPLTVGEMTWAVLHAAEKGDPPQEWLHDRVWALMCDVRVPGQAASDETEVQAAYAQIVCRALWAAGGSDSLRLDGGNKSAPQAQRILEHYLDETLADLGSLRDTAVTLLEDYLVAADGSRTLITERQAESALPGSGLKKILESLETAAILRAEEHQGGRYFELGHDWLAKKVFELKRQRQEAEAQRLRDAHAKAEQERQHKRQRRLMFTTAMAIVVALMMAGLGVAALISRGRAHTLSLLHSVRENSARNQTAIAAKILLEFDAPEHVTEWDGLAIEALSTNWLQSIFHGHDGVVTRAVFSPDGKSIASSSLDGTARIWSADGRNDPVVLRGHGADVYSIAWSSDGTHVVTASKDMTARVWTADGSKSVELAGHQGPVLFAAFSRDGRRVATASRDGTARIFLADGTGTATVCYGHSGPVRSLDFSPDGKRLVTSSEDGSARVFSLAGEEVTLFQDHFGPVNIAVFSPDGKRVLTASEDGTARIFEADGTGVPIVFSGHRGAVLTAAWSPDGTRVVTGSEDRTARVWPVDQSAPIVLTGHEAAVVSAAWSGDGAQVVTASFDNTARAWRLARGDVQVLYGHEGRLSYAAVSPESERAITASYDGTVRLWARSGAGRFVTLRGHQGHAYTVAWSSDGTQLLTAGEDGTARTWQSDGKPISVYSGGAGGDDGPVKYRVAAWSPDGKRIAAAGDDGYARVWKVEAPADALLIPGPGLALWALAWSPDGRRIAMGSDDGTVSVARSDGSGERITLGTQRERITSVAFSPDGSRVASASTEGQGRVWRSDRAGEPLARLVGHHGRVSSIAFSPDGKSLVTASADKTLIVWHADDPGERTVLRGHKDAVHWASFSPTGKRIVSGGQDNVVRVWDATRDGWEEQLELTGVRLAVSCAVLSPGDQQLAAAFDDGVVRLWPLGTAQLEERLRASSTICLSAAIRQKQLDEPRDIAVRRYEACERSYGRTPRVESD